VRQSQYALLGSLLLACSAASAQSNVTVYGSVDAGVSAFNDERGGRTTKVESGNRSPDRFGFRGSEDLGGGLRALFQLESGFNLDDGQLKRSNAIFSRYAWVGLASSTAGTLSLGHMPDFMYEYLRWTSNGFMGSTNFFHPGNLDNQANQFQLDNAIKYETPTWHGITLGAMNGFGEQPDDFNRARSYSFGLRYVDGPARLGAAYTVSNNRSLGLGPTLGIASLLGQTLSRGDPAAPGATYTNLNADRVTTAGVTGSYRIGRFTPHAMFTQIKFDTPGGAATMRNVDLGSDIGIGAAQTLGVSASTSTLEDRRWSQFNLIHMLRLSPRTTLYGEAAWQRASGEDVHAVIFGAAPASGQSQRVLRVGVHHLF
jgi:predicted porin